jgi:uncharacterized protein (DUF1800 family)
VLNHIQTDLGGGDAALAAFLVEQMDPTQTPISSYPLYRLVRASGDPYIASGSSLTASWPWAQGGCGAGGDPLPTTLNTCTRDNFNNYQPKTQLIYNALYGRDQVRQRAAFAMHKIIVVSLAGALKDWPSWILAYLRVLDGGDNIYVLNTDGTPKTPVSDQRVSPGPFGNFRDILYQITRCPPMGQYLDMVNSTKTRPNENYAREIMQLFSIGLFVLNPDGTQVLDGSGNPIPTYTQDTVNNVTAAFTGWVFSSAVSLPGNRNPINYFDPMIPGPAANHDTTQKRLLDLSPSPTTNPDGSPRNPGDPAYLSAGQAARPELDAALDNIFYHPNVGPFICKNLIQQLVTSNPSPAYVARVASVFNNNGSGVRGDMAAVFRAIWLDTTEARGDLITDPNYGKLREPVQYVNNLLRLFNAQSYNDPGTPSEGNLVYNPSNQLTPLEQEPLRPATVFSYFSPFNVAVQSPLLLGPEFGILDTTTAIRRANFINTMLNPNGAATAYGIAPQSPTTDPLSTPNGTKLDLYGTNPAYTNWVDLATNDTRNGQDLLDRLNLLMMHNSMSPDMYNSILTAIQAVSSSNPLKRVKVAIYLVASSSQYQVQR